MFNDPMRLAVLISGGGTTLLNLHRCITDGALDAVIDVVVSSRGDVLGVERARQAGLRTVVVDPHPLSAAAFDRAVEQVVEGADLVCMAGFLRLWTIPKSWTGRVINIHPALLPEFGGKGMYGRRVHEAVIAAGRIVSGCTVHFCDNEYDHGPIIIRREVPVLPDDTPETLAARVFEQECIAYPEAVRIVGEGLTTRDDRQ